MSERVSVPQAAKELGLAPQGVREYMKRGLLDIGDVLPSVRGSRQTYLIFRDKLDAYIGRCRTPPTQEGGQQKSSQEAATS